MKKSKRKFVVFTSLVGLLTLTSALLLALAPPPLAAEGYNMSAADHGAFLDDVFKTIVAPKASQWKYIYLHHSSTLTGNASTLAVPGKGLCDHFVIGNGSGCQDGEIQVGPRWSEQKPPAAPEGVDHIEPDCISICLVGDYDRSAPTPMQLRRAAQLVSTLQSQLRIAGENVIVLNESGTPSGVGKYFPVTVFRDQILP